MNTERMQESKPEKNTEKNNRSTISPGKTNLLPMEFTPAGISVNTENLANLSSRKLWQLMENLQTTPEHTKQAIMRELEKRHSDCSGFHFSSPH